MSEDEKRAQSPDGMPAGTPDDGDAADVTAHSAAGPRAGQEADGLFDSRDLHDLAIKWSRIHGPGVLPGVIQSACAPMLAGKRHAFRCAASGGESVAGQACPGTVHAALRRAACTGHHRRARPPRPPVIIVP